MNTDNNTNDNTPSPDNAGSFKSNPTESNPKKPTDEIIRDVNFKRRVFSEIMHGKIGGVSFADQPVDRMLRKVEEAVGDAKAGVSEMLRKGAGVREQDRKDLRPLVLGILLERFDKFSNEELMNFAALMVADRIMSDIEAAPYGGDKPDLLG